MVTSVSVNLLFHRFWVLCLEYTKYLILSMLLIPKHRKEPSLFREGSYTYSTSAEISRISFNLVISSVYAFTGLSAPLAVLNRTAL